MIFFIFLIKFAVFDTGNVFDESFGKGTKNDMFQVRKIIRSVLSGN